MKLWLRRSCNSPTQLSIIRTYNICSLMTKRPKLHVRISQRDTEMEITMRYGYAASIASLASALTKRESDGEWAFDWKQVTADTRLGVNFLSSASRNGRDYGVELQRSSSTVKKL